MTQTTRLRLILGDQLNARHSWFARRDDQCLYLIAELLQETGYVKHHIQKICGFFLAMEQFAAALQKAGHRVLHLTLDDTCQFEDLPALIRHLCQQYQVSYFDYQRPDEYRLLEQLRALQPGDGVEKAEWDSEHFLVPYTDLSKRFKPGKPGRMETFYRKMRREHNILMRDGEPEGGQWNYDDENRCKLKPDDLQQIPAPLLFASPTREVLERLKRHKVKSFGTIGSHLPWPVTRQQSLKLLNYFCQHGLPHFGRFQDAMTGHSEHRWSLYHSRLSFALNSKMLDPRQVIDQAINTWQDNPDTVSLAQIEGFVRQILGWREFIRGVYWSNMPAYKSMNALDGQRDLPSWFWSAKTRMNCLHQAIDQSLNYAYAHHIQRLMITGNFCLLAGIDPDQVDDWYLGIYMDAIEWVELPNTRGMSQYADGGIVGSKPYAGSGNYVQKMSDYCRDCSYDVKARESDNACPLNSLYWHFLEQHHELLRKNPRTSMVFRGWDRKDANEKEAILARARWCLEHVEQL